MGFSGKNTGVGCLVLLQGIFPPQGLNPRLLCLLHWQVGPLPLAPPASLVAQRLKRLPPMRETWVRFLGQEDALEEGLATHSSILA